jgi:segregation and condensation protein B
MFATTPEFLSHFALKSRRDLPGIEDLRAAGLLDPVDLAFEQLAVEKTDEDD